MNIKKATKVSAVAVAAVAAVGIGAVSFAAWESNNKTANAQVTLGSVALVGFTGDTTQTLKANAALVPYDQKGTYNGATVVWYALPEYEASANYTITVSYEGDYTFYASVGTQATTAPSSVTAEGWQEIAAPEGATGENKNKKSAVFEFPGIDGYTTVSGQFLNIILVSSNNADMGGTANFTVTLALL